MSTVKEKNDMRIIGNDVRINENFWEVLEGKIGKILNILGSGLPYIATYMISVLNDFSAA